MKKNNIISCFTRVYITLGIIIACSYLIYFYFSYTNLKVLEYGRLLDSINNEIELNKDAIISSATLKQNLANKIRLDHLINQYVHKICLMKADKLILCTDKDIDDKSKTNVVVALDTNQKLSLIVSIVMPNYLDYLKNNPPYNLALFGVVIIVLYFSSLLIIKNKFLNPLSTSINDLKIHLLNSSNDYVPFNRDSKGYSEISTIDEALRSITHYSKRIKLLEIKAAIGQASSHLAHDMRSPISVLQEFVDDMDEKSKVSHNSEFKTAVKNSINKLDQMANELNDYSKATQIKRGDVVLNDLVMETVIPEIKFSSKHNVRVKHNVPDDLCVHIDEDKMARVIINIANNAVQAIDHEEGEININVEAGDPKVVKMTISDNGKGIAEKHLPHVFDGFYTFGKRNGTGLGLSYCKQVVDAHGGEISVISELGKGTTFEIELPDSIVDAQKSCHSRLSAGFLEDENGNPGSMNDLCIAKAKQSDVRLFSDISFEDQNVLLVDDDSNMRFAYKRHIIDKGGVIVFDADKPEDVTHASEFDFNTIDIAIVDYEFKNSEKNGIDIVGFLKEKGISNIYLCTGHFADANVIKSAMNAGASAVLNKSIG